MKKENSNLFLENTDTKPEESSELKNSLQLNQSFYNSIQNLNFICRRYYTSLCLVFFFLGTILMLLLKVV